MSRPRRIVYVCARCGCESCQVTAWVECNTGHDAGGDNPLPYAYCLRCDDGEAELAEREMTDAERAAELRRWKLRAGAACEAMVVRALDLLGVEAATHLVANAMSAFYSDAEDPHDEPLPDVLEALQRRVDDDRRHRAAHPDYRYVYPEGPEVAQLLVELDAIWTRAHQGVDVRPDALDRLRERQDSGAPFRGPGWEQALERAERRGETGVRSSLGLTVQRAGGFWTVGFEAPAGRRIAKGEHTMLGVAAELCLRALDE